MLESLLQNATNVLYKMRQVFYCKMQEFHWKMWQLLKNATFITKWFGSANNVSDRNSNETFLKTSYFPILLNFWLTKLRLLFSQNKAIASKAWRYNFCTGRNIGFWILENGFQTPWRLATTYPTIFKNATFKFFENLQVTNWKHFVGKQGKDLKTVKIKMFPMGTTIENKCF